MTKRKLRTIVAFAMLTCAVTQGCSMAGNRVFSGLCPVSDCVNWEPIQFVHDGIPVIGFRKPGNYEGRMVVYIEGDGKAWRNRYRISKNPTPTNPVGLKLAVRDSSPGLLYLARPCQYVQLELFDKCNSSLWSTARYSIEVVEAMNYAITHTKRSDDDRITLVGYSGGGVIAMLLASFRTDVDILITVAAPMDTDAWTKHHGVSPLSESINPSSVSARNKERCEFHFYGGRDKTVPASVAGQYFCRLNRSNTQCLTIADYDHRCCWVRDWLDILATIQVCPNSGG